MRSIYIILIMAFAAEFTFGEDLDYSDHVKLIEEFKTLVKTKNNDECERIYTELCGEYRESNDVLKVLTLGQEYIKIASLNDHDYDYELNMYESIIATDFNDKMVNYGTTAGHKDSFQKHRWVRSAEDLSNLVYNRKRPIDDSLQLLNLTKKYLDHLYTISEKEISDEGISVPFELRERISKHLKEIGVEQREMWTGKSLYQPGWNKITDETLKEELESISNKVVERELSREHKRIAKRLVDVLDSRQRQLAKGLLTNGVEAQSVQKSIGPKLWAEMSLE